MPTPQKFLTPTALVLTTPSPWGGLAVAVHDAAVAGISFAHASPIEAARRLAKMLDGPLEAAREATPRDPNARLAEDVLDRLVRFLDGEPVDFSDIPLALDHLSPFQRRVVVACRGIAYGATRSYGQVAIAAGSPGAARAVGQVMAGNRMPLVVPCHRVVAAGGKLGGFSAPQGVTLKRRLLTLEAGDVQTALSTAAPRPARLRQRRLGEQLASIRP